MPECKLLMNNVLRFFCDPEYSIIWKFFYIRELVRYRENAPKCQLVY